jgi:hypothetical protein
MKAGSMVSPSPKGAAETALLLRTRRVPGRSLLFLDDEMDAPVFLHTIFIVLETDGTILPIARRLEVD